MKDYVIAYDDHGHPLELLGVAHSENEAKEFVCQRMEWENDLEWEDGEIEQIEGEVLLYCFGDAQYVIIKLDVI